MAPIKLSVQNDFKIDDRFGKYPADWVLHRMGDLGDFYGGATPSTQQPSYWNGSINWLVPSDISTLPEEQKYIYDTGDKITEAGLAACSAVLLPAGTVTMSSRATLGDCVILGKEICTNQGFISCKCNEHIINEYLLYWIGQYKNYISRYAAGTTFLEIGRRQFKKLRIAIPEPEEQALIVGVLADIDRAIEVTRKAIDQAGLVKKALMQHLLSGRLKPDGTWRTPDEFYMDDKFGRVPKGWRVKSSNDIFFINKETLSAKTPDDYEFNYITIEAVTTEEIQWEAITRCVFKDAPSRARRVLSSGDILLSTVRPNLKSFANFYAPNEENWICSTGFSVFTPKPNQDRDFYFYQILGEIGEKQFYSYVAGTNYPAVNDRDMRKLRLLEAPYPEQKEISKILSQISQSIIMKKNKIKVLQTLRKSLMQNLLTGKIRVQVG